MRTEGWDKRLSAYLDSVREVPFQFGVHDCLMFVGKAVEATTGVDYYSIHLGYLDEAGAEKILAMHGGIEGLLTAALGAPHRNPLRAKRGDIVTVKMPLVTCGVVADCGRQIVMVSHTGTIRVPITRAWHIWSY